MKIAVTSGYSRSRHAIGLVTLLHRAGHEVGLCLNVKMLSLRRFGTYFRLYGRRLFSIVRRRALASQAGQATDPEVKYIAEYLREQGVPHSTLAAACAEAGARLVHVANLNAPQAIGALKSFGPELVLYAGGGILRKRFLDQPRIGTLNAHAGPLPAVRGMNASEWSLLYGLQPGATVHFVDTGIDTGSTLFFKPQPVADGDTVPDIRGKGVVMTVTALLEAVERIVGGNSQSTPQDIAAGRQHFVMHPLLLDIVELRIREERE